MKKTPVMAFFNNKGGVGKSTATINTAAALAKKGKRVLLIDLDESTNATDTLKIPGNRERAFSIGNYLAGTLESICDCCIWHTRIEGVAITDTENSLKVRVNSTIAKDRSIEPMIQRMKEAIEEISSLEGDEEIDYILVDLPPSLDELANIMLSQVTHLFYIADTGSWAEKGVINFLSSPIYQDLKARNPGMKEMGLIYNKIDHRTSVSRALIEREVVAGGSIEVLPIYIPNRTKVDENSFTGDLSSISGKESKLSMAFDELSNFVIKNVKTA